MASLAFSRRSQSYSTLTQKNADSNSPRKGDANPPFPAVSPLSSAKVVYNLVFIYIEH